MNRHHIARALGTGAAGLQLLLTAQLWAAAPPSPSRTFGSPEEAVRALAAAVKAGKIDEIVALFGSDGQDLVDSSDPATARRNQQVFSAAFAEGWRLVNQGSNAKSLVIGNEGWPFPVPIVKDANRWRFDTAAGKEEILARRIGRNELAAIGVCRVYVDAQRRYARDAHDGKATGLYAKAFQSDSGRHNGLYWPAVHGQPRSPLGDLVAQAADEGTNLSDRKASTPFHGYYYRILTSQGAGAPGGARSYVVDGELSGGFALIAWPAQYDASGVMTFMVNQDGTVLQKDLGPDTASVARAMKAYEPDATWQRAQ